MSRQNDKNIGGAYIIIMSISTVLGFLASYCYGVINEQDHLIARSILWGIGTFVFSVFFCGMISEEEDNKKEENKETQKS